jgi:hypothetical protein
MIGKQQNGLLGGAGGSGCLFEMRKSRSAKQITANWPTSTSQRLLVVAGVLLHWKASNRAEQAAWPACWLDFQSTAHSQTTVQGPQEGHAKVNRSIKAKNSYSILSRQTFSFQRFV